VVKEYVTKTEQYTTTERRIEGGVEYEDTVVEEREYEDWDEIVNETEVATFFLGDIEIKPEKSDLIITNHETYDSKGRERIGEKWLTVKYLPVEKVREFLVVGELAGNTISSGKPFIVTDLTDTALVERKAKAEAGARTGLTILAMILFFVAFNLIIGPIVFMTRFVPVIGPGIRFMIGFGSLILAIILVLIIKFVIMFWWLLLLILAAIIVLIAIAASKKKTAAVPVVETPTVSEAETSTSEDEPLTKV